MVMLRRSCICAGVALLFIVLYQGAAGQDASNPDVDDRPYTLNMPVDEVKVMFHVADHKGDPIEHLKKDDLELFDNGKLQKRKVAFHEYSDLPIRVGFLLDNSPSMKNQMDQSQAIATELIKDFFRANSDQAFTMGFGVDSKVTQDWTEQADAVAEGIGAGNVKEADEPDGTAMFDAIYRACKEKFAGDSMAVSGNFILLFTDGEDNSSHVWESEAVDMCQRARTAIYVFTPEWKARATRGQQILEDLVAKTGGRMFFEKKLSVHDALATTVSDMRYQYELIYAPPGLKRDGSFHQIKMKCKVERAQIQARSGYYAYAKR
jgi:Ca-activated chloride channel homolog